MRAALENTLGLQPLHFFCTFLRTRKTPCLFLMTFMEPAFDPTA